MGTPRGVNPSEAHSLDYAETFSPFSVPCPFLLRSSLSIYFQVLGPVEMMPFGGGAIKGV